MEKTIKDLKGSEPIGACVTIGIKGARGFPTERDRWHIVVPREADGVRGYHPGFKGFNGAPAEQRHVLRGNLVHAHQSDCFEYYLRAQVLKDAHPDRKPACSGNGVSAMRWEGPEPDNFMEIRCPAEHCEYRQCEPPKCKPFMRFLFRLRWKEGVGLPTPLVKFTSGSWYTTSNFLGLFEYIDIVARQIGLKDYSLFGFPFTLTLMQVTKRSRKTKFPVVVVSADVDPVQFFKQQRQLLREVAEPMPMALTDEDQQKPALVYEDHKQINIPGGFSGTPIDND